MGATRVLVYDPCSFWFARREYSASCQMSESGSYRGVFSGGATCGAVVY